MSNVRRRPSLFSYLSFQRSRERRTSSISTQLRPTDQDPYEKPGRHSDPASMSSPLLVMSNRWFKAIALFAFVGLILYFLTPSGSIDGFVGEHTAGGSKSKNNGQSASDPSLGTAKCTKSSSKSKPIVQYALMVDAGSTGSRIHVYRFNNCGDTPELEKEDFKMTKPGLSSFNEDAEGAAKSLDVLLQVAMENVPEGLRACTPIAVKATAGLRLLGPEKSKKILDAVRNHLETYPFPVVQGEEGVQIMDGKDEGVYAWITTNYLLGKIGTSENIPTAAIFDLGGGSTQIVFQPTFPSISGGMPEELAPGDHKYDLNFGGRHFSLYQHSHLGFGLMEARKSIHKEVAKAKKAESGESWNSGPILNPCLNVGMSREVEVQLDKDSPAVKVNMVGPSSPAVPQCRALAEKILNKTSECTVAPCSFNGIHQPSLDRTFAKEDVFVFSYFYDRLHPLGMPDSFTLREMMDTTAKVCGGESSWDVFMSFEEAKAELTDRPEYCLDLNFMMALLHTGYELPLDREVKTAKKIKNNELGWCLGASLPLLDQGTGGWQCKIKQIS